MKNKIIFAATFVATVFCISSHAQKSELKPSDLKVIEGVEWAGTLTYLDYRSNKPTSIKSNILLTPENDRSWTAEYKYPDEPKANSRATITLSDDGAVFNGQKVVEASRSESGRLKIVTTMEGTDNDKKALFRFTYLISSKQFSIKKEVQVEGSTEFFERNTYNWSR